MLAGVKTASPAGSQASNIHQMTSQPQNMSTSPVHQLIYVSDLVDKNERQLAPILESAVRRNTEDGITGMLLYSGGNFLQVLEGPTAAVQATYKRICQDRRHRNTTLLLEQDVPERQFGSWSMGYRLLSSEDVARFPEHAPHFQFGFRNDALNAKPGDALELLTLFCKGML
jgi:hypothetical protein